MDGRHDTSETGDSADLPQDAVIASFKLSNDGWGVPEDYAGWDFLEETLIQAIDESGVGEFDGIERGMGFLDVFMYGPNADALLEVVEPLLRSYPAHPGSSVVKQYGEPGAPEVRIDL